jgi:hypothetical protein
VRPIAFAVLRLIAKPYLVGACTGDEGRLLAPFGLIFGGRLGDPRARRGDRGSGLARARKQSQAVIVGGVSLEAAPPARQDYAETASIIVNGRKGLYEHAHRGAPAVAASSARPAIGRAACPLVGQPKSAPQYGASDSYSAARFMSGQRGAFSAMRRISAAPQSRPSCAPTCSVCKGIFGVNVYPACRRFPSGRAKLIGSFHSDGLIGRDARTTSAPGRACSAAPVDSGGASRRL